MKHIISVSQSHVLITLYVVDTTHVLVSIKFQSYKCTLQKKFVLKYKTIYKFLDVFITLFPNTHIIMIINIH